MDTIKLSTVHEALAQEGLVDLTGLARALEVQARDGGSLGKIIADLGLAAEEPVAVAIARALGLEYVDLEKEPPPAETDCSLPAEFCRKRRVIPLGVKGRSLRLAMADPLDQSTIHDVEFRTSKWVAAVVASETAILQALKRLHPESEGANLSYDLLAGATPQGEVEEALDEDYEIVDPAQLARSVKLPPIVRLVNLLLTDAAKAGASDIHVEPQESCLQVRHRVDGILHDVLRIPKHLQQSVISRLKIISGMDIAEHRKPQDGRSRLRVEKGKIDLRVSTLPTNFGEKVVIRLLDGASARVEMGQLGFAAELLKNFQDLLARPQGMVLVTGPTGSGKTSTLYAALNWVKSPAKNIITVEDPIEYQIPGLNQVQINTRTGMTFASGLRSILRQDPNVVLVGEIRDSETAGIALEAAQTGHLLMSTLHTNDASSSVTRLLDLGMEPFMIASSLAGILAQRLARRVCAACAGERPPSGVTLERIGGPQRLPAGARWVAGRGCEPCHQSGYRGRLAIHELLVVNDEIRDLISRRAPEHEIREAARRSGMRPLLEDGVAKAAQGLTTLEEILRVAPRDEAHGTGQEARVAARGTSAVREARPAPGAHAQGAPGPDAAGAAQPAGGPRDRVLVVEDSPTVVTVVKYFLELEGFEVLVAENGLEGLEMAHRVVPEVVVSDLNMPGMDGMSLIKALRDDPRTRHMAILMLTSETSIESETRGLAVGADDYLAKPVEPKRLAARVRAVLARSRAKQAAPA